MDPGETFTYMLWTHKPQVKRQKKIGVKGHISSMTSITCLVCIVTIKSL